MANPFYIPRQPGILERVAPLALDFMRLKQEGDIASTRAKLMEEDITTRKAGQDILKQESLAKYGTPSLNPETGQTTFSGGLEQKRMNVLQTQAKTEAAKVPVHQQQFSLADSTLLRSSLKQQGLDKPLGRFLDTLDNMAKDESYTTGKTYLFLKANWPAYQKMIVEDISKELEKTQDPMQVEKLTQVLQEIGEDTDGKILDMAMPDVARSIQMENIELNAKVAKAGKESLSNLGKLINEYNSIPKDSPMRKMYEERMAKEAQATGEQIMVGPDGTVTVTKGPIGMMQKKTTADIETKLFNAGENLARLNEIASSYKPEFLQMDTKLDALNTKWQEIGKGTPIEKGLSMLFGKADEADKQKLEQYSAFKRDSINNLNLYIQEITGAQMSEKEADRIRKGMPDPGEGLFDGDSPSQFESKWRSAVKSLRMAQARYTTLLRKGLDNAMIQKMANTDSMPSINSIEREINNFGDELKRQGMNDADIAKRIQEKYFSLGK